MLCTTEVCYLYGWNEQKYQKQNYATQSLEGGSQWSTVCQKPACKFSWQSDEQFWKYPCNSEYSVENHRFEKSAAES